MKFYVYHLFSVVFILAGWTLLQVSTLWCNERHSLPNGHTICSNVTGQLECTVNCNEGYMLVDNSTKLNCSEDLEKQIIPKCIVITCKPIDNLDNGFVYCTNVNKVFSVCNFGCLSSWKLFGSEIIKCNLDGNWNSTLPACEQDLGRKNISGRTVSDDCGGKLLDTMIVLDGSSNSVEFVESVSLAKAFVFGLQGSIDSGVTRVALSQSGSINSIPCKSSSSSSNYTIELSLEERDEGSIQNTLDSIEWFGASTCPIYGNAIVQSQVYFLEYGRPAATKIIIIFLSNSVKSIELPLAEQATNQGIVVIAVGKNKEEVNSFASTKQQSLNVPSGSYSELNILAKDVVKQARKCEAKDKGDCGDAGTTENGEQSCLYLSDVGEICQYVCNDGYFLSGSGVLRCNLGSTAWDYNPPTCSNDGECPDLTPIINGNIQCSNGKSVDSDCSFTCEDNFFRRGTGSAKCLMKSNGEAAWNDELPVCETDLLCEPALVAPDNADVSCPDGNRFNSLCTVECHEGFVLEGNRTIRCSVPKPEGGSDWSSELPSCGKCVKEPCDHDILILIQVSGSTSEAEFEEGKGFLLDFIDAFGGAVETGDIYLGVVQITIKAEVTCDSGNVDDEFNIALDLDSYSSPLINSKIDEMEHKGGCSGADDALSQSALYFDAIGRAETNRVLVLLTSQAEAAKDAAAIASENEIKILAVGLGAATSEVMEGIVGSNGEYIHVETFDRDLIHELKDVMLEGFVADPNAKKTSNVSKQKMNKILIFSSYFSWLYMFRVIE